MFHSKSFWLKHFECQNIEYLASIISEYPKRNFVSSSSLNEKGSCLRNPLTYSFIIGFKFNKSKYTVLFVVSGSIKKLFSIDCVDIYFSQSIVFPNIYFFSIFFSIDFARWKSVGLPHTACIVNL